MSRKQVRLILRIIEAAILVSTIYAMVSLTAFALTHPELTQTQVLQQLVDALLWK